MSTNPIDLSKAVKVSSVPQEYQFIRLNPCLCGGRYEARMQSLAKGENSDHYDVISTRCSSCGRERIFIFDINSFFGKHK